MRVLLVDGSDSSRRAQRPVLAALGGREIVECVRGSDALSRATAEPPDLLVAAGRLLDMDGLDLVRAFRSAHPGTPVVYIGDEVSHERVVQAYRAGADNYIASSWTPDLLNQRIIETLAASSRPAA